MKGYVITMTIDGEATTNYWDGSAPIGQVDGALFIDDLATARQTAGSLQAAYTDRSVGVLAANKGIQLTPPVVAAL